MGWSPQSISSGSDSTFVATRLNFFLSHTIAPQYRSIKRQIREASTVGPHSFFVQFCHQKHLFTFSTFSKFYFCNCAMPSSAVHLIVLFPLMIPRERVRRAFLCVLSWRTPHVTFFFASFDFRMHKSEQLWVPCFQDSFCFCYYHEAEFPFSFTWSCS